MSMQKGLFGNEYMVEDKAISISLERYNELIKKELVYDELTKDSQVIIMLSEGTEKGEHE